MIISFDLDGVLFLNPDTIETEPPLRRPLDRFYPDRLRKGTVKLIHDLQARGFIVWIYTSSYRREFYLRRLFRHYRVKFSRIVNADRHNREVQEHSKVKLPSKLPTWYHISLHIDDEEYVVKEGKSYGFRVLQISGPDPLWAEKVLAEAERVRENEKGLAKA